MLSTPAVLAVLVEDRRRVVMRDFAYARRFRIRRRVASAFYALAAAFAACGVVIDDEAGLAR